MGRCDKELLKFLKNISSNVVYSGLNNLDAKYDQIICDGTQISYDVVTRLIEQGHRKIAYIGETQNENRYVGYCSALTDADISVSPNTSLTLFIPQKRDTKVSAIFLKRL